MNPSRVAADVRRLNPFARRLEPPYAGCYASGAWNASVWLLLFLLLSPGTVLACRYNVRDVGFVDLETEPYRLHVFTRPESPADAVAFLKQQLGTALREANVEADFVAASESTNHPAFRHLPRGIDDPVANAVLVSPDGQALSFGFSRPGFPFRESLASALEEIAFSPTRAALVEAASHAFATVLLIDGQESGASERARQNITRAFAAVRAQMPSLPKVIAAPPALVVLDRAGLARERVLLWSLGLETSPTAEPRAAVVYGRARWMGPLMQGAEISEPNLTGLLSIIGADCECGLDVAWTLGTRLLVRWDEARHTQVAQALGFDPESPLVKLEVNRIVARSRPRPPGSATNQAVVLSSDFSPAAGQVSTDRRPQVNSTSASRGSTPKARGLAEADPVLTRVWQFAGALALVVSLAGLALLWISRRRQRR